MIKSILGVMNTTQNNASFPSLEGLNDSLHGSMGDLFDASPVPELNVPTKSTLLSTPTNIQSSPSKKQLFPPSAMKNPAPLQKSPSKTQSYPLDAPTLYKQIRQTLSNTEFEKFASIVAQFNAATLTIDEAVKLVHEVLDGNTALSSQMEVLMRTSGEELA